MSTGQPPEEVCPLPPSQRVPKGSPMSESTKGLPKEQDQPEGGRGQHHPLGVMAACGTDYHRP